MTSNFRTRNVFVCPTIFTSTTATALLKQIESKAEVLVKRKFNYITTGLSIFLKYLAATGVYVQLSEQRCCFQNFRPWHCPRFRQEEKSPFWRHFCWLQVSSKSVYKSRTCIQVAIDQQTSKAIGLAKQSDKDENHYLLCAYLLKANRPINQKTSKAHKILIDVPYKYNSYWSWS